MGYQGAFPAQEWNVYELPVGKDFYRKYNYYPQITALYYFNDDDPDDDEVDLLGSLP